MASRFRWSRWGLTINTNQNKCSTSFIKKFNNAMKDILENIGEYLTFKKGEYTSQYFSPDSELIFVISRGNKLSCYHSHALIALKHKANIHLDREKIAQKIKDTLKLSNIHIDWKILRSESDVEGWKKYMNEQTYIIDSDNFNGEQPDDLLENYDDDLNEIN